MHRCPTRRDFSGTGFEPVTKQATVRYLYHSATAATSILWMARQPRVGLGLLKKPFPSQPSSPRVAEQCDVNIQSIKPSQPSS
ncbi:hypothetical protein TNCV_718421 [Trichonephila clavipes]|nr:hypothetical protein TNCV_718421 [Trichonephila clavipes]